MVNSDHRPLQWLHNLKGPNSKLQRWKIKLNEYDFDIKYLPGKENHVANALSRIKPESCFMSEGDAESNVATVHSAGEDSSCFIPISERPLNIYRKQYVFKRAAENSEKLKIIFNKTRNIIGYIKMTEDLAKHLILNNRSLF